jgi:hypothetical protein
MTKTLKQFDVTARLKLMVQITIKAESLADALEQSKTLREQKFVSFEGEYIDGSLVITGVSKSGCWDVSQEDSQ